jgi:hypothetical protein
LTKGVEERVLGTEAMISEGRRRAKGVEILPGIIQDWVIPLRLRRVQCLGPDKGQEVPDQLHEAVDAAFVSQLVKGDGRVCPQSFGDLVAIGI